MITKVMIYEILSLMIVDMYNQEDANKALNYILGANDMAMYLVEKIDKKSRENE